MLIDGANQLHGVRALLWLVRRWPALRREMTATEGYLAHRLWFAFPLTMGVTSWWADDNAVYRFAHQPEHLRLWRWATGPGRSRGGWLARYRYVDGGPLWGNGVEVMMQRLAGIVGPASGVPPALPTEDRQRSGE